MRVYIISYVLYEIVLHNLCASPRENLATMKAFCVAFLFILGGVVHGQVAPECAYTRGELTKATSLATSGSGRTLTT